MESCREVHGTWVDLVLHHLEEKDGGYVPDLSWSDVDARLMLPVCILCSEAAQDYMAHFLEKHPEGKLILDRIADLQQRIQKVDAADEAWRNSKVRPQPREESPQGGSSDAAI